MVRLYPRQVHRLRARVTAASLVLVYQRPTLSVAQDTALRYALRRAGGDPMMVRASLCRHMWGGAWHALARGSVLLVLLHDLDALPRVQACITSMPTLCAMGAMMGERPLSHARCSLLPQLAVRAPQTLQSCLCPDPMTVPGLLGGAWCHLLQTPLLALHQVLTAPRQVAA